MRRSLSLTLLGLPLMLALGCSGGGNSNATVPVTSTTPSATTAVFSPSTGVVPLPNVLATATAPDPLVGLAANTPLTPPQALAYVNLHEVGGTNAVSGTNAPIYLQFSAPVVASTVTPANIKVFQITPDAAGTENNPLGFTDISGMFTYQYAAGGTDLFLFPNFPLLPGTRYLYVVTNRVLDAATGGFVSASVEFEALKSNVSLQTATPPLNQLDPIWENVTSGSNILFSGYHKVMNDLITAAATTTVTSRANISLMGRFITTGAGFILPDPVGAPTALAPVEAELRAFAAGSNLAALGGLPGKTWSNAATIPANTLPSGPFSRFVKGSPVSPDAYWTAIVGTATAAPTSVGLVALGTFASGDLNIDPVVMAANKATMDLQGVTLGGVYPAYNPASGVTQPFRDATGKLTGFYHTDRTLNFVYIAPDPATVTPPAHGYPVVIYQHGITSQKETVIALAGTLTAQGYALIAIDLPLHGQNAVQLPTPHTTGSQWGQDFMAIGAPLATRTNLQQAVVNLSRLEFVLKTGGLSTALATAGFPTSLPDVTTSPSNIKFVGVSLGAIVGSYYLASNATLSPTGLPYTPDTLKSDMKGFLNNPGGRIAYIIQNSPAFNGPNPDPTKAYPINQALAQAGIPTGSPTYHQFFQITQSVVDPADPASVTAPLYGIASGAPVDGPGRLSGRVVIQEATSSAFDAFGNTTSLDGDQVISNIYTRYLGNAIGGRDVLGSAAALAVGPHFSQLAYTAGGAYLVGGALPTAHAAGVVGTPFMLSSLSPLTPKELPAAISAAPTVTSPTEGYFQFDQTGIAHAFLINPANPVGITLGQRQLSYWLATGLVVDPTQQSATMPTATPTALPQAMIFQAPERITILGH